MVLIICTKNESFLTNRYRDMVKDGQKVWTVKLENFNFNFYKILIRNKLGTHRIQRISPIHVLS